MTLPVELETSVNQLRAKHTALIDAVNAYRSGTIDTSKQDLLTLADDIDKQLTVEEYTLLGQVARVGRMPSLVLDFVNDKYAVGIHRLERFTSHADILTFSRSTGGGRFNAQGQYEWLEADVPRIDYDPETGECRGLLVEEQGTNLCLSTDLTTWAYGTTVVTPAHTERFGTHSYRVASDGVGCTVGRAVPGTTSGNAWIGSIYVKPEECTHFDIAVYGFTTTTTIRFDTLTGEIDEWASGGRLDGVSMEGVGDGWFRLAVSCPGTNSSYSSFFIRGAVTRDEIPAVGEGFLAALPQIEVGAFATSPIPTDGAAVTRAADIADVEVGDWFNPSEGAVVTAYDFIDGSVASSVRVYPGALRQPSGGMTLGCYSDGRLISQRPRTQTRTGIGFTDESSKIGYTYARSGRVAVANQEGALGARSMELVMETTLLLSIASNAINTNTYSGHVRSIEYHPRALSDTQLQEHTQ